MLKSLSINWLKAKILAKLLLGSMNQGVSPANDDGPCAPFALSSYGTPASPS
jgi:hypothetical protein